MNNTLTFLPRISVVFCFLSIVLSCITFFIGLIANDPQNPQWSNKISSYFVWNLIITAVVILLITLTGKNNWDNKIKLTIYILGPILCVLPAILSLNTYTLIANQEAEYNRRYVSNEAKRFDTQTENLIKRNTVLSQKEVEECLTLSDWPVLLEPALAGWRKLLDAKLIDPNMMLDTTSFEHDKEISLKEPLLFNVSLSYSVEFTKILLEHGANPNARDKYFGNTALLNILANSLYPNIIPNFELLALCGTDINAKNKDGKTVFDLLEDEKKEHTDRAYEINAITNILKNVSGTGANKCPIKMSKE